MNWGEMGGRNGKIFQQSASFANWFETGVRDPFEQAHCLK